MGLEFDGISASVGAGVDEGVRCAETAIMGLRNLGHTVNTAAQSSGLSAIIRTTIGGSAVLVGGADPRREGIVLAD